MAPVEKAPRLSAEEAVRVARDLYALKVTASPLPSERDQNFHLHDAGGAQYVLKIANPDEAFEILDLQNQVISFLANKSTGLDIPRVIVSRHGNQIEKLGDSFARLLTWVEGECLAGVQPHSHALLRSLGHGLARMDCALEAFDHPAARRYMHWDLRHAGDARQYLHLIAESRQALLEPLFAAWERLDWSGLPFSVIHADANDYNVLVNRATGRVSSFVDYGDLVHSATICDLAVALAYAMLDKDDPIAAAAAVVSGYAEVRPLGDAELEALYPLAAVRLCVSVCHAAHQCRLVPENAYLNISNVPAWALLEKLSRLPAGWPTEVFQHACRPDTNVAIRRRAVLAPSLSLSYSEPLHIIRGWRQRLYSASGRAYLDCVNNVSHVGHSHPRVAAAVARQMELLNTNTRYLHENLVEYLERLTATLPDPLRVAFLVCSGSEANELALRLARAHTGKRDVIVVDVAYHGNTNALVEISPYKFNGPGGRGKPDYVQVVEMPDVYRGRYRDSDAGVRYAASVAGAARQSGNVAAFFCESALGCGGQIILPADYLQQAFAEVHSAGGVCIADEVQTGFGRAGSHFWMFETQGVVPDIVTMGKPIGNGHPMGAVVTTREIAASFANGMEYFNTFGGNPVSCAAGLAVLDVIRDESLQQNALETGEFLLHGLRELQSRHGLIGDVRGHGLFAGIELVRDRHTLEPAGSEAGTLVDRMKELGVLLSTDGPFHNVVKIKPPIVFERKDASTLLEKLESALCNTLSSS